MNPFVSEPNKPSSSWQNCTRSLREDAIGLILRDLDKLNWSITRGDGEIHIAPPGEYSKDSIRESMSVKREEILIQNKSWIDNHLNMAVENLAKGTDVLSSRIIPEIEVCQTVRQHELFRILRYYWSAPYSEYVGRRIKLIIRDKGIKNKPVIGLAALGSPIIHIPARDDFIGWDKTTRTQMINNMMDAYVIGALPPYNHLLGGKLVSYLLASNEVRKIYKEKYQHSQYNQLAGIFTTSLYGRSSQYNRINYKGNPLYKLIGYTKGYGTFHLANETFSMMNKMLKEQGVVVSNKFGEGPCWKVRLIRTASQFLGFCPNALLNHSYRRAIYFVPFASNTIGFLKGEEARLKPYSWGAGELSDYWNKRWHAMRRQNPLVIKDVKNFNPDSIREHYKLSDHGDFFGEDTLNISGKVA